MSTAIGRNDPCHCGSGKKYKKCHLEKDDVKDRKEREKAALNAAKVAAENEENNEKTDSHGKDAPKRPPEPQKQGWMGKMATKAGFFKSISQKRLPSGNKGG